MPSASLFRRIRRHPAPRRPTFLYIGTPKAGSTWIYEALQEHPDVFIPIGGKDVKFFDANYHRGWRWYLRHFGNAGMVSAVGEVSHDYYLSEQAAKRIHADLPDVRLICCLREPGDFAVSALRWLHAHTRRFGAEIDEIAQHPAFTKTLNYRKNLEPYFDLFRADQLLVVYYEHLKADPRHFISELYKFIGVDPSYEPRVLMQRSNPAREPRNELLLSCAFEVAQLLRDFGATSLITAIKQTRMFERVAYAGPESRESISGNADLDRIAAEVRHRLTGELSALSKLIGKPLPPEWLSAAAIEQQ